MSIIAGDFVARLSGGAGNASGNASLGGVKSSTAASSTVDQLFDAVSAAEALAGTVEYRCIYLHNANATDTMTSARVWVSANTPLAGTTLDIGVGTAAVNGTEQTIANESTAPTGVSWSTAANEGAALSIGNIPAGQHKAVWVRRTISAAAAANNLDNVVLRVKGDTAA